MKQKVVTEESAEWVCLEAINNAADVAKWVAEFMDYRTISDYPGDLHNPNAFVVLSCGRFSPDGPNGAQTPDQIKTVEESNECQERIQYAVKSIVEHKRYYSEDVVDAQVIPWPTLVLNGATQQIPAMERWANEAIAEHGDKAAGLPVEVLGKTPFPQANTKTQFQDLNDLARERNWKELAIVTSDYHRARSYLYFKYLTPELQETSSVLALAWVRDDKVNTKDAVALIAGEVQRCMLYTASGDLGFPWDLGWERPE